MITDKEQLKTMSFADMVRQFSTPEKNISGILNALDEQRRIFEESEIDFSPLETSLEEIGEFDQDVRLEICQYFKLLFYMLICK